MRIDSTTGCALLFAIPAVLFALLVLLGPGYFQRQSMRRRAVIEELQNPQPVRIITEEDIFITWSQGLGMPGFPYSPPAIAALWEATRSGVEVHGSGSPVGLIRVWHWCGNDPIGKHIARVPLVDLARFIEAEGHFDMTEYGWNGSQFFGFDSRGEYYREER